LLSMRGCSCFAGAASWSGRGRSSAMALLSPSSNYELRTTNHQLSLAAIIRAARIPTPES
jgi:hypothetical protein